MLPRDITSFGGVKVDAKPQQNPECEVAASEWNRTAEDVAQLTRSPVKAWVQFESHAWGGASHTYAAADVTARSQWGTGDGQKPTVTQTAAGRYTIAWATAYTDALAASESVALVAAEVACYSSDAADTFYDCRALTVTSNAITIVTKAGGAAADVGDNSAAAFTVFVRVY